MELRPQLSSPNKISPKPTTVEATQFDISRVLEELSGICIRDSLVGCFLGLL